MRYLIIGMKNPNALEKVYSDWAIKISAAKGKKEDEILDEIITDAKKLCIGDDEFEKSFNNYGIDPPYTTASARHILRKIEEHKGNMEKVPNYSRVEIEHIMPQKKSEGWTEYDQSKIDLLGNLTLIGEEYNKKMQNESFEKKKNQYVNSTFQITNWLSKCNTWKSEDILKRQEEFAKTAVKIWKL